MRKNNRSRKKDTNNGDKKISDRTPNTLWVLPYRTAWGIDMAQSKQILWMVKRCFSTLLVLYFSMVVFQSSVDILRYYIHRRAMPSRNLSYLEQICWILCEKRKYVEVKNKLRMKLDNSKRRSLEMNSMPEHTGHRSSKETWRKKCSYHFWPCLCIRHLHQKATGSNTQYNLQSKLNAKTWNMTLCACLCTKVKQCAGRIKHFTAKV